MKQFSYSSWNIRVNDFHQSLKCQVWYLASNFQTHLTMSLPAEILTCSTPSWFEEYPNNKIIFIKVKQYSEFLYNTV